MGFLDDILSAAKAAPGLQGLAGEVQGEAAAAAPAASGAHASLVQEAMGLLNENNNAGGLGGLVQQFEAQGLGHVIGSWTGPGQNLPISGAQLSGVLGDARLQQLAARVGLPPDAAASALAAVLPSLIDRMTPNGTVEHTLLQEGLSWLEGRPA
jgi:uncharacterized protein YidB (DUF937 family)